MERQPFPYWSIGIILAIILSLPAPVSFSWALRQEQEGLIVGKLSDALKRPAGLEEVQLLTPQGPRDVKDPEARKGMFADEVLDLVQETVSKPGQGSVRLWYPRPEVGQEGNVSMVERWFFQSIPLTGETMHRISEIPPGEDRISPTMAVHLAEEATSGFRERTLFRLYAIHRSNELLTLRIDPVLDENLRYPLILLADLAKQHQQLFQGSPPTKEDLARWLEEGEYGRILSVVNKIVDEMVRKGSYGKFHSQAQVYLRVLRRDLPALYDPSAGLEEGIASTRPVWVRNHQTLIQTIRQLPGGVVRKANLARRSRLPEQTLDRHGWRKLAHDEKVRRASMDPPDPPLFLNLREAIVAALKAHPGGVVRRLWLAEQMGVHESTLSRYRWVRFLSIENRRRAALDPPGVPLQRDPRGKRPVSRRSAAAGLEGRRPTDKEDAFGDTAEMVRRPEVKVEVVPMMDTLRARKMAEEIVRFREENDSPFSEEDERLRLTDELSSILSSREKGAIVLALKEEEICGCGHIVQAGASTVDLRGLVIRRERRKSGLATRIFQELIWWIIESGRFRKVQFTDGSPENEMSRIGKKFFFDTTSKSRFYQKSLGSSSSLLEQVERFSRDAFLREYLTRFNEREIDSSRQQEIRILMEKERTEAMTAVVDLTTVPIYIQSRELFEVAKKNLPPIYKGILFYPVLLPETTGELDQFRWQEIGFIMEDKKLSSSVPNPKGLPVRRFNAERPEEITRLNAMDLMVEIYRGPLGVPPHAENVRAVLFTDAEGNARLILIYV